MIFIGIFEGDMKTIGPQSISETCLPVHCDPLIAIRDTWSAFLFDVNDVIRTMRNDVECITRASNSGLL